MTGSQIVGVPPVVPWGTGEVAAEPEGKVVVR
jgi:hypothetical protein